MELKSLGKRKNKQAYLPSCCHSVSHMESTITKTTETQQDVAFNNDTPKSYLCSDPDTGICPVLRTIAEGRAILPSHFNVGLLLSDAAFTSDIAVEEPSRKARGA